jgi:hypothetical protein
MKPPLASNHIAVYALGVSVLALIVSALLGLWQIRLQSRVTAIEEERRQEERKRRQQEDEARRRAHVDVRVELPNSKYPEAWELIVAGLGPAPAERVTFHLESVDGGDAPWMPDRGVLLGQGSLPIKTLLEGQERRFRITLKNYSGVRVVVRWKDGTGPQEQEFELQTQPPVGP